VVEMSGHTDRIAVALARLLERLEADGLLLLSDARLPSVVALVGRKPVAGSPAGSWWSHPKGREIFALVQRLVAHEDVLATKLVSRKVTFVHRRLWPAFLAAARAREPWQMRGLSAAGRSVLARLDAQGEAELSGRLAKELELRLLAHAEEVHTASGAHALRARSWDSWRRGRGRIGRSPPLARAEAELGEVLAGLNARHGARGTLPFAPRGA
jgi:hypothetical protein